MLFGPSFRVMSSAMSRSGGPSGSTDAGLKQGRKEGLRQEAHDGDGRLDGPGGSTAAETAAARPNRGPSEGSRSSQMRTPDAAPERRKPEQSTTNAVQKTGNQEDVPSNAGVGSGPSPVSSESGSVPGEEGQPAKPSFWRLDASFTGKCEWDSEVIQRIKNNSPIGFQWDIIYCKKKNPCYAIIMFLGVGTDDDRKNFKQHLSRNILKGSVMELLIRDERPLTVPFTEEDGSWGMLIKCVGTKNKNAETFREVLSDFAQQSGVICEFVEDSKQPKSSATATEIATTSLSASSADAVLGQAGPSQGVKRAFPTPSHGTSEPPTKNSRPDQASTSTAGSVTSPQSSARQHDSAVSEASTSSQGQGQAERNIDAQANTSQSQTPARVARRRSSIFAPWRRPLPDAADDLLKQCNMKWTNKNPSEGERLNVTSEREVMKYLHNGNKYYKYESKDQVIEYICDETRAQEYMDELKQGDRERNSKTLSQYYGCIVSFIEAVKEQIKDPRKKEALKKALKFWRDNKTALTAVVPTVGQPESVVTNEVSFKVVTRGNRQYVRRNSLALA